MYRITFVLGDCKEYRLAAMNILLRAVTMVNRAYFEKTPGAMDPRKLRYEEEFGEQDDWNDASAINAGARSDCEDIACYYAGFIQARRGILAWPEIQQTANETHVVVRMPNGKIVDPTLTSGRHAHKPGSLHRCTALGHCDVEQRIVFVSDLFNSRDRVASQGNPDAARAQFLTHRALTCLLGGLMEIDKLYLREHPATPSIYDAGVIYKEEPPGREDWQDIPTSLRRKDMDCEDAATWRAAELSVRQGIDARPTFTWKQRPSGAFLYHIQTTYPDGRVEDPSRTLGMR